MPVQTSVREELDPVIALTLNICCIGKVWCHFSFFFIPPYKYNKKTWRKSCFLTVSVVDRQEGWFSISSSVIKAQSRRSQYWFEYVLLQRNYNWTNPHSTVIQVQPCRNITNKQGCVLLVNPVFTRKNRPQERDWTSTCTQAVRHCAWDEPRGSKQATSREQALTPLDGSPRGAPHAQLHSLPTSPAVSVGRRGGCQFLVLQEAHKWNVWAWLSAAAPQLLQLASIWLESGHFRDLFRWKRSCQGLGFVTDLMSPSLKCFFQT